MRLPGGGVPGARPLPACSLPKCMDGLGRFRCHQECCSLLFLSLPVALAQEQVRDQVKGMGAETLPGDPGRSQGGLFLGVGTGLMAPPASDPRGAR